MGFGKQDETERGAAPLCPLALVTAGGGPRGPGDFWDALFLVPHTAGAHGLSPPRACLPWAFHGIHHRLRKRAIPVAACHTGNPRLWKGVGLLGCCVAHSVPGAHFETVHKRTWPAPRVSCSGEQGPPEVLGSGSLGGRRESDGNNASTQRPQTPLLPLPALKSCLIPAWPLSWGHMAASRYLGRGFWEP